MSYEVTLEYEDTGWSWGYKMKLIHNGEIIDEHWDNGEPEDRNFARDFNWIPAALKKAYELGKQDAKEE